MWIFAWIVSVPGSTSMHVYMYIIEYRYEYTFLWMYFAFRITRSFMFVEKCILFLFSFDNLTILQIYFVRKWLWYTCTLLISMYKNTYTLKILFKTINCSYKKKIKSIVILPKKMQRYSLILWVTPNGKWRYFSFISIW